MMKVSKLEVPKKKKCEPHEDFKFSMLLPNIQEEINKITKVELFTISVLLFALFERMDVFCAFSKQIFIQW